jgi:hypothetical protein
MLLVGIDVQILAFPLSERRQTSAVFDVDFRGRDAGITWRVTIKPTALDALGFTRKEPNYCGRIACLSLSDSRDWRGATLTRLPEQEHSNIPHGSPLWSYSPNPVVQCKYYRPRNGSGLVGSRWTLRAPVPFGRAEGAPARTGRPCRCTERD